MKKPRKFGASSKKYKFLKTKKSLFPVKTKISYQSPNDNIPDENIAAGLRNPWKFSFDHQTGDVWIGDVGPNGTISNDLKGTLMSYPITFGEDNNGELYLATFDKIYKITACGNDQSISLTGQINSSSYYNALDFIQSDAKISGSVTVNYSAGKKIELNTGFKVGNGAVFTAQIDDCQ